MVSVGSQDPDQDLSGSLEPEGSVLIRAPVGACRLLQSHHLGLARGPWHTAGARPAPRDTSVLPAHKQDAPPLACGLPFSRGTHRAVRVSQAGSRSGQSGSVGNRAG